VKRRLVVAVVMLVVTTLLLAPPLLGHELGMLQVEATFLRDGTYTVDLLVDRTHLPPEATSDLGAFLKNLGRSAHLAFDGRAVASQMEIADTDPGSARVRLTGRTPVGVSRFTFRDNAIGGFFVLGLRNEGDVEKTTQWVEGGTTSAPFALDRTVVPKSRWSVVKLYLVLGFTHILPRGLDHVLFVLGIFLLAVQLRPVLWQVSAFTVAHTITLALTVYGVVSLPSRIVEPLIALSIVYVAVENVFTSRLHAWRPIIVFCFGLLHGMGFAGVLTEIGLPRSEFIPALLAFNAGVECGQLTVILAAFLLIWLPFRKKPWYRRRIVVPASIAISVVACYWFVERAFFTR
jgi:hydrogenase/urease accessory protein HupE